MLHLRSPRVRFSGIFALAPLAWALAGPAQAQEPDINKFFDDLPAWKVADVKTQPAKPGPPKYQVVVDGVGDRYDFRCTVTTKNVRQEFPKITAAGIDDAVVWPGALLQGKSVRDGTPKLIRVKRSPLTITMKGANVAVASKVVNDPSTSSVEDALAELRRNAGRIPARVDFKVEEASTLDQATLSMGVSAKYQMFSGDASGSISQGMSKRTVVAMLKQPMYTVYFDRGTATSAQLLDASVTLAELQALKQHGDIGDDNVPLYVASVTYGKMMTFLMTVDSVHSADEIKAALNGSYEGFQGGGNLTASQKRILANASYKFVVIGGQQESAQQAIASADWHKFFVSEPADAALPLEFEVKTVADDDVAKIVEAVQYDEIGDCVRPTGYEVNVNWVSVEPTAGACHVPWWFYVRAGTGIFQMAKPDFGKDRPLLDKVVINHDVTLQIPEGKEVTLYVHSEIWPAVIAPNPERMERLTFKYPFNSIERGRTFTTHSDVNFQPCPARFTFGLTKTPMY